MNHTLLNELPKFSPWPHRLLGIELWEQKVKNSIEVTREYEGEKWGPLWERVRSSGKPVSLDEIEDWLSGGRSDTLCLLHGELTLMSPGEVFEAQLEIVTQTISSFLPMSTLVELGAGYGHIILNLARKMDLSNCRLLAGEYTSSGVNLLKYLSQSENLKVSVGRCDFSKTPITDCNIPGKAVIYTSYAATYIPEYSMAFIEEILSWRPKVVVHFEPLFEHCDQSTLLGAMQRRYIEVNGYNRNLLSILRDGEKKGSIKICLEQRQVFGNNPFLPFSIIAWYPINGEVTP